MKTISERAEQCLCGVSAHVTPCKRRAERVLRELVEDAAEWWKRRGCATADGEPVGHGADVAAFRQAFLGPPSAEEIVSTTAQKAGFLGPESALKIVSALRAAGMLKEEA